MKRPFAIVAITAAPSTALRTSPRPPKRLVPPITAAEIASSSSVPPPWSGATERRLPASMMPPTPAMRPEIMKTRIRMRGDADAGAPRRLGVAADRVDVAAERRPLRDERPEAAGRR